MRYPIDTEKYIAAMRREFGCNETAETVYREALPLVNDCYQDGREGREGYPWSLAEEISVMEDIHGGKVTGTLLHILTELVQWCNEAYAQGRGEYAGQD